MEVFNTMIKGIGASSGIAIAKAYKLVMPDLTVTQNTVEDVAAEIKNLKIVWLKQLNN